MLGSATEGWSTREASKVPPPAPGGPITVEMAICDDVACLSDLGTPCECVGRRGLVSCDTRGDPQSRGSKSTDTRPKAMLMSPRTTELNIGVLPRDLRLASGLVLFSSITAHVSNRGGLISLDTAETGLRL
jgi:hypothetical protein